MFSKCGIGCICSCTVRINAIKRQPLRVSNLLGSVLQANKVELKSVATGNGVSYEQFGPVSGFVSVADFRLNGLQVDASRARFEHIGAAGLANGVYVEVKGVQDNRGVFMASKVEFKSLARD